MPGSDSNNPTYDFVPHPAGSDTARGLPAVGKLVYRTDTSALEVCTATTPDANTHGGGTWSPLGGSGGSGVQSWTPIVRSTSSNVLDVGTFGGSLGYYTISGNLVTAKAFVWWAGSGCTFGAANAWWTVELPLAISNDADIGPQGYGHIYDASVDEFRFVHAFRYNGSGYTSNLNCRLMLGGVVGNTDYLIDGFSPWTWEANDELHLSFSYLID